MCASKCTSLDKSRSALVLAMQEWHSLPHHGVSHSNDPLHHTRLLQCTQRCNRTQQHTPTQTEPLVLMDIARAAPNAQEVQLHNTWSNTICLKTNPSTQAMCMFPQEFLCQMLMWLHQGASAYAWWMWPLQAAGENPSQPDQTVRSFSCKDCTDMSTTM